jgi:hypothetical protein
LGRFLSADALSYLGADGELRGYNLYTYCGNNPVMYTDAIGCAIVLSILASMFIGMLVSVAAEATIDIFDGQSNSSVERYLLAAITGALSGAVGGAASNLTLGWRFAVTTLSAGLLEAGLVVYENDGFEDLNWGEVFYAFGKGALSAGISFAISNVFRYFFASKKLNSIIKNRNSKNIVVNTRLKQAGYGQYKIGIHGYDVILENVANEKRFQNIETLAGSFCDYISGVFF